MISSRAIAGTAGANLDSVPPLGCTLLGHGWLYAERVGVRQLAGVPLTGALQRFQRGCLVEVDDGVELIGEAGVKLM
jgi:hypothetical protein